ncbi:MAG: hypothetical protein K2X66_10810 [Cyanobacteria bacterium]|nr:hypothetical protein [Cyanobacteriota bacterium]
MNIGLRLPPNRRISSNYPLHFKGLTVAVKSGKSSLDKRLIKALSEKFPKGTVVFFSKGAYSYNPDIYTIQAPTAAAQDKIEKALRAAEFSDIQVTPFAITDYQRRLQAGIKALGGL